jgi:hypothetical protein
MAKTTQFFGIRITLATSTATNLLQALQAIDPSIGGSMREFSIQADVAVPGALLIGDAAISATRYGLSLISTATANPFVQFGVGSSLQNVPIGAIYLFSAAAMKVNVFAWA